MDVVKYQPQKHIDRRAAVEEQVPSWLKYLVGAFPQQKPNKITHAVMESQFDNYDPSIMLQAVKDYVSENKYWPAVSELREYADGLQPDEGWAIPLHIWHKLWTSKNWKLCNTCGERTPNLNECVFCKDMDVTSKER